MKIDPDTYEWSRENEFYTIKELTTWFKFTYIYHITRKEPHILRAILKAKEIFGLTFHAKYSSSELVIYFKYYKKDIRVIINSYEL